VEQNFNTMSNSEKWWALVEGAKRALEANGYALERVPGRGRSNMWHGSKGSEQSSIAIRTTQDRYIAFPPLNGGKNWKTLDDVDLVAVATVRDWSDNPMVDIYLFEASTLRKHFSDAYAARTAAGMTVTDEFGMWVGLDADDRNTPAAIGSGIAVDRKPIGTYSFLALAGGDVVANGDVEVGGNRVDLDEEPPTIAEILAQASEKIAAVAGVAVSSIRLDCKISH
jgi:hypothetical protein